jgi:hypothetical protein
MERLEAASYLQLENFPANNQAEAVHHVTSCRGNSYVGTFSGNELHSFNWHGSILGEFTANREEGIRKGIRYVPYQEMLPLAFNSATLSPPSPTAARAAHAIASLLSYHSLQGDTAETERLVANISRTAFEELCSRYRVDTHASEAIFDDNATMALFQFLGMLKREPDRQALTFFDTGRVMPQALQGLNPEFLADNFHPAIDVWGNRERVRNRSVNLCAWKPCSLIEHYTDHYRSDSEILQETLQKLDDLRPEVIVIPTVTRAGRRLAFIELCEAIKAKSNELGISPLVILDDAQGLGRMSADRYTTRKDGSSASLWNFADAVLLTGAKVTGALMGSGAIVFNKEAFKERQLPLGIGPLQYRARQYAFVSDDAERIREHNRSAPGVAQTPEIASLSAALRQLPQPKEVYTLMRSLRTFVVDKLKGIPGIRVLEPGPEIRASFEDSIVAFHLRDYPNSAADFRRELAKPRNLGSARWDNFPITLPAIITAPEKDVQYLRLALDPARAVSRDGDYILKVDYVIRAIDQVMRKHFLR